MKVSDRLHAAADLTCRERAAIIHLVRGWVGSVVSLDAWKRRQISVAYGASNHDLSDTHLVALSFCILRCPDSGFLRHANVMLDLYDTFRDYSACVCRA
jgi:hypothetical protein